MKILIISQYFYPESFRVNNLAKELVQRGHAVTVLTGFPQYPLGKIYEGYGFDRPYEKEWCGVRIERVKMRPRGKTSLVGPLLNCYSFVREGKKWVQRCTERFEAIYVFEVSPVTVGLPALAYKEKFGTPVFFNVQDLWPENVIHVLGIKSPLVIGPINKVVDKIYKESDRILCSSKSFVTQIQARGVPEEKLIYWPQFCDTLDADTLQRPTVLQIDHFNIVYTGNVGTAQGLHLLVEAMAQVENDLVHCYIVGSGRALDELKEQVVALHLQERIHFMGQVSEHEANAYVYFADAAYLSLIDNVVMDMTVPAKLQTYLACGTPILGAVSGESAQIIKEAQAGVCVQKEAGAIAEGITKLQQLTPEQVDVMRKYAQGYFATHFNKDMLIEMLEQQMKEAAGRKKVKG